MTPDFIKEIELTQPECRLELVDGQFLMGGSLAGSRWLLQEIMNGWGLEFAIAFAPLNLWQAALEQAYPNSDIQPGDPSTPEPRLGSDYVGEHWITRNRISRDLREAVALASLGRCIGHDFIMRLGNDAFTPDLMFMAAHRLDRQHHYYFDGPPDLVIEVLIPEQAQMDHIERFQRYEAGGIEHYWIIDPVQQHIDIFRLTETGYQQMSLDPDGCYRGVTGLTFTPAHLWLPHDEALSSFTAPYGESRWVTRDVEGEDLQWGSLPFQPQIDLHPVPIQFDQMISWCPEAKLEGYSDYSPLIGGPLGTRNALGMLLMTMGLVETVRLVPLRDWVTALKQVQNFYAEDAARRERAWQLARTTAQQLHEQHQVAGVGIVGDLVHPERPWTVWSEISFVFWDAPDSFSPWEFQRDWQVEFEVTWIQPRYCIPAEWQLVTTEMEVLVGIWDQTQHQPVRKRSQLFPKEG